MTEEEDSEFGKKRRTTERKDLEDEAVEHSFEHREYQIQMAKTAFESNSIVYVPTGSGKTYISIVVIKRFHDEIKRPFLENGKRIIFTAPRVALVDQQADVLRKYTPFAIGSYNGYMQVEFWDKDQWTEEFVKNQVLVMGSQILLDILDKGFLQLSQVALLVFDECHHATANHPMNMIMRMHYKDQPGMPRILGLTATLIKKNIAPDKLEKEVASLESNLHSKLVKLDSLELIKGMYADPKIEIIECDPVQHHDVMKTVKRLITLLENDLKMESLTVSFHVDPELVILAPGEPMVKPGAFFRKIQRQLTDILVEIEEFGIFGGSIAIQCHRNRLQCLANAAEIEEARQLYAMVMSQLEVIRHLIESAMSQEASDSLEQINKFSSPKVLKCIERLRAEILETGAIKTLIFVERRLSAKILYTIIKILSLKDPDFAQIKPDYIVGQAENAYCTYLSLLLDKQTRKSVFKFASNELNLLVASNILEEGIDIPSCNLVIKFDTIKTFCSFIQSKGRARDRNGKYVVLQLKLAEKNFKNEKRIYEQLEDKLQELQQVEELEDVVIDDVATYVTPAGAMATSENSISMLYRYCYTLGADRFSIPAPIWFCKKVSLSEKFVCVLLPIQSSLVDPIEGPVSTRVQLAKKKCALEAIKQLHLAGQLDDNLRSCYSKVQADIITDSILFPNWIKDDKHPDLPDPGTKNRRRVHMVKAPSPFIGCAPGSASEVFVHSIDIEPMYNVPADDQRRKTFLELLSSKNENFAILASKKLPTICKFPIFTNAGRVDISIGRRVHAVTLQQQLLDKIKAFHSFLFGKLLELDKSFLVWNFESGSNNFLIAPVTEDGDLDEVKLSRDFSVNHVPEEITRFDDLHLKVIIPTYRTKSVGNYLVTEVQFDASPMTPFPNNYDSYKQYFSEKWGAEVKILTQPLVSVKQITAKLNFLNPKGEILVITRKAMHENDEFAEIFIPELCRLSGHNHLVSAEIWLKAVFLPSILHRTSVLLHANDLRSSINRECRLGSVEVAKWEDFIALPTRKAPVAETSPKSQGFGLPRLQCHVPKVNESNCPWGEKDPIDPDKLLFEGVSWGQLEEFSAFTSSSLVQDKNLSTKDNDYFFQRDQSVTVYPIKMLTPDEESLQRGPELRTMYAAITTTSANDSVNMERLETLGDAYLKLITSLYLFTTYDVSEGILTHAKGKLVGNRNLLYCALKKGIPNILNHKQFEPKSDWAVPNLSVPNKLVYLINASEISPGVLNSIVFNEEEKFSGEINVQYIREVFENYEEDNPSETTLVAFLNQLVIPDKNIADCVEAVLGSYIETCGPVLAASVVTWFGILPDSAKSIMSDPVPSNIKNATIPDPESFSNLHLLEAEKLETVLDYKFKNCSFLLEALTHPSYVLNRLTNSNQRLEFLGDAVLDFLVTAHIYEKFAHLNPGEMTDLRSALVNNVTFASLAVRYGFHTFLLENNPTLASRIENFVEFQQRNNHKISDDHLLLIQECNVSIGIALEVPKVLGDIFESIVGAVFLDCGKDFVETWRVIYPLMKFAIDLFGTTVPKNAVRKLHESVAAHDLEIGKPYSIDGINGVQVKIVIYKNGEKVSCVGSGANKHEAKRAAAKGALRLFFGES
ncbi:endoribonuclease Dicer-like isoform X2 [Neocloeon triangulifer]|nr:endoribonuclease Dicer-like isoform X2 [Neocloeon triangulifer]